MTAAQTGPAVIASPPLDGMSTSLFVQTRCDSCLGITELMSKVGIGVVYTFNGNSRSNAFNRTRMAICHTRDNVDAPDILVDAARYSGKNRIPASRGISPEWISHQRGLGLPWALTDSGYCAAGDREGLRSLLRDASALPGRVVVVLALAHEWLTDDADLLRAEIDEQDHPVAIVLEHPEDPCGKTGVVPGLVHVLGADAPVGLLRADTSALGALAHGASIGAVGTTSGLRHLFPVSDGHGRTPPGALVVPDLLTYIHIAKVRDALVADPHLDAWACDCAFCREHGDGIAWIAASPAPGLPAFQHSAASLARIGRTLAAADDPARAWAGMCRQAQADHFTIIVNGKEWRSKPFLRRWAELTPTRTGV